ncbi:hypothetical protein yfred0001_25860 [Yersinia frederiksenii ATCC 33641]|nr:hypothetical protein yfred0001_25860 [Yersinia frederiksenii ATCC 33641]
MDGQGTWQMCNKATMVNEALGFLVLGQGFDAKTHLSG